MSAAASPAERAQIATRQREVDRLRAAVAQVAARGDVASTRALNARLVAAESALAAFSGAGAQIVGAL